MRASLTFDNIRMQSLSSRQRASILQVRLSMVTSILLLCTCVSAYISSPPCEPPPDLTILTIHSAMQRVPGILHHRETAAELPELASSARSEATTAGGGWVLLQR